MSGNIFARNLDCLLILFREIHILLFYKDSTKLQAKTCLGEGSLRGSHLYVSEHLLQQHHHHTDILHGKKQMCQKVTSTPRFCLLHRQNCCLFTCFRLPPVGQLSAFVPAQCIGSGQWPGLKIRPSKTKPFQTMPNFQLDRQNHFTKIPVFLRDRSKMLRRECHSF